MVIFSSKQRQTCSLSEFEDGERERETDKVFSCLWLSDREAIIGRISGQKVGRER